MSTHKLDFYFQDGILVYRPVVILHQPQRLYLQAIPQRFSEFDVDQSPLRYQMPAQANGAAYVVVARQGRQSGVGAEVALEVVPP